jgi:hypothetical protein
MKKQEANQRKPSLNRLSDDVYQIKRDDEIVALTMQLTNSYEGGRWALYDRIERRLEYYSWETPKDVYEYYLNYYFGWCFGDE